MKILHTGDWHIGRFLNEFSLLDDQKYILEDFFKILDDELPDVVLISGDVYDRSIPPKEAVELLDKTLTRIIEDYKIPTMIVSGNHDSQERLSFASELLKHKQLFIEGNITENFKKIPLYDKYGAVNFYLVPYSHPAVIRDIFNESNIRDHQDAFKFIMDKINLDFNPEERNVLVTHNYFVSDPKSILLSESERSLSCGGVEYIDASLVEAFDYVALGHLHQGQKVKEDYIRYSGSLLKYSFSEVNHKKGVVIVELKEKGSFQHRFVELKPERDLLIIEGKINYLLEPNFYQRIDKNAYILARLTDTIDLYDPIGRLRAIYPNIMQIERTNYYSSNNSQTSADVNYKNKNELELFSEFYQGITERTLDEARCKIVEEIINEISREGYE